MATIHQVTVNALDLEQIQKVLPPNFKHVCVADTGKGLHPPEKIFVGEIQQHFEIFTVSGTSKKRMTLKEILPDGLQGQRLDIFVLDQMAVALQDYLKRNKETVWMVMSGVQILKYYGDEVDIGYSLKVGIPSVQNGQIWLLTDKKRENPSVSKSCLQKSPSRNISSKRNNCVKIKDCNENMTKVWMWAVVKSLVKNKEKTNVGSYHVLVSVVDPSCLDERTPRKDLLLHIFLNDPSETDIPGGLSRGDILLLKNMMVERFGHTFHGKVFSSKQVIKFSSVEGDDIMPITDNKNFTVIEEDKDQVLFLRKWWAEKHTEFSTPDPVSPRGTPFKNGRQRPSGHGVNQGSPTRNGQNKICENSSGDDDDVDEVPASLLMSPQDSQGDLNTKGPVVPNTPRTSSKSDHLMGLSPKFVDNSILTDNTDFTQESEPLSGQSTSIQIRRNEAESPSSIMRSQSAQVQIRNETESPSNQMRSQSAPIYMSSPSPSKHANYMPRPLSGSVKRKLLDNETHEVASPHDASVTVTDYMPQPLSGGVKRKPSDNETHEDASPPDSSVTVTVLRGDFTDISFQSLFAKSEPEKLYRISAIIKDILINSGFCLYCKSEEACTHDWVEGYCVSCGDSISGWKLQALYSRYQLKLLPTLPCYLCEHSAPKGRRSVHPLVRMQFLLLDPYSQREEFVNLNGDAFEEFFGYPPRFCWIIQGYGNKIHEKLSRLKLRHHPMYFGIRKYRTYDENFQFNITQTSLEDFDKSFFLGGT